MFPLGACGWRTRGLDLRSAASTLCGGSRRTLEFRSAHSEARLRSI